jgi:hypothetical protein
LGVSPNTVAVWRRRYRSAGFDGLRTKACAQRPDSSAERGGFEPSEPFKSLQFGAFF